MSLHRQSTASASAVAVSNRSLNQSRSRHEQTMEVPPPLSVSQLDSMTMSPPSKVNRSNQLQWNTHQIPSSQRLLLPPHQPPPTTTITTSSFHHPPIPPNYLPPTTHHQVHIHQYISPSGQTNLNPSQMDPATTSSFKHQLPFSPPTHQPTNPSLNSHQSQYSHIGPQSFNSFPYSPTAASIYEPPTDNHLTTSFPLAPTNVPLENISTSYAKMTALNSSLLDSRLAREVQSYTAFQGELSKEMYVIALDHWSHKEYLKVFRSWKYIVLDRLHRLKHMYQYLGQKHLRQLWQEWKYQLQYKRRLKLLMIQSMEHWAQTQITKSFKRFRGRIRTLHWIESEIIKRKLIKLFAEWHFSVQLKLNAVQRFSLIQRRVQQHQRSTYWNLWKEAMWTQLNEREISHQCRLNQVRLQWSRWRRACYYHMVSQKIRHRRRRGCLLHAYTEWRYHFTLGLLADRYKSKKYSRVLLRRWKESTQRHRHIGQLVRRADLFIYSQVFTTWRSLIYYQRLDQYAERKGDTLVKAHLFYEWIQRFRYYRRDQLATKIASQHGDIQTKKRIITHWNHIRLIQTRLKHQIRKFHLLHRSHLLRTYFADWMELRRLLIKDRMNDELAERHLRLRIQRSALVGWSNVINIKAGRRTRRNSLSKQLNQTRRMDGTAASHIPPTSNDLVVSRLRNPADGLGVVSYMTTTDLSSTPLTIDHLSGDATPNVGISTKSNYVPYAAQVAMADLYHAHRRYRLIVRQWSMIAQEAKLIKKELKLKSQLLYIKLLLRGWNRTAHKMKLHSIADSSTRINDRQALLVTAYNSWVLFFNRSRHFKDLLGVSEERFTRKFWLKWCVKYRLLQTRKLKQSWIELNIVTRKFFSLWTAQSRRNQLLQTVLTNFASRWQRTTLHHWQQLFALQLQFLPLKRRLLKMCWFRQWKRQSYLQSHIKQLMNEWAERGPRLQLTHLWTHWKEYFTHNQSSSAFADRHRLRHLYVSWQRRVHWSRFDRQVIHTFDQRRELSYIVQTWLEWKRRLITQREELVQTKRATIHTWIRQLMKWKKASAMKKLSIGTNQLARLKRGVEALHQYSILHRLQRQLNQRAQQYHIHHIQRLAFTQWSTFIGGCHRQRLLADQLWRRTISHKFLTTLQQKYHWRQSARTKLQRVVQFLGRPSENAAIQLWRRYTISHAIIRQRMEQFRLLFAEPVRRIYINKLTVDAWKEWRIVYAIRVRTKSIGLILSHQTSHHRLKRSWLDWSLYHRAGQFLIHQLQRHAIQYLIHRARTRRAGRRLKARTDAQRTLLVLSYWRMKANRIIRHRFACDQFKEIHVTQALILQAYTIWRRSFLLLRGPLSEMASRRHIMQMKSAIESWINTLNSRNVYRWQVQLFKQKVQAMVEQEMHRRREAEERQQEEERLQRALLAGEYIPDELNPDDQTATSHNRNDYSLQDVLHSSSSAPASVLPSMPPGLVGPLSSVSDTILTVARFTSIVHRWRRLDLTLPFIQWRNVLRSHKAKLIAYHRARVHEETRRLRLSFIQWRTFIAATHKIRAAMERGDRAIQIFILQRWKLFLKQELQDTLARQVANRSRAAEAWNEWRTQFLWIIRLRAGEIRSVHHWANRKLITQFRVWKTTTDKFKSLSLRQNAYEHQAIYQLQYRSFAHWLSLFVMSTTRRTQLALAAKHHQLGLLRRSMIHWHLFRTIQKEKAGIVESGYQRQLIKLQRHVFDHWVLKFVQSKRKKLSLKNYLISRAHHSQSVTFLQWKRIAVRLRSDRTKIVNFIRLRLQRHGWQMWRLAQATQRQEADMDDQARKHHKLIVLSGRMRGALLFWSGYTQRQLTNRQSVYSALHHTFQPRFFRAWHIYVVNKRRSWRFYRRSIFQKMLGRWFKSYAESKLLRTAQTKIDHRFVRFKLHDCMRAWRRYARKINQLRDAARILVTSRGGCPIYAHARLLTAVPPPGPLARTPTAIMIVRDEERLRTLTALSSPTTPSHLIRAHKEVRQTDPTKNRLRRIYTKRTQTEQNFSESIAFDTAIQPITRRLPIQELSSSASVNSSLTPSTALVIRPSPIPSTARSLTSPDPSSQAVYNQMCVASINYEQIVRELTNTAPTTPTMTAPLQAQLHPLIHHQDDTDSEPIIVYRSPLMQVRAIFTYWFTTASLLTRARLLLLHSRQYRVLQAFRLNHAKRIEVREKHEASQRLRQRQCERHAFRLWFQGARIQHGLDEYAKELYWAASNRMATRNAATAIRFWCDYARQGRIISERQLVWNQSSLRYGISVWQWRAHRSRRLKDVYQTLWLSHHRRLIHQQFHWWRIKAIQNDHFKRMCRPIERLHGQGVLQQWYSASLTLRVESFQLKRKIKNQTNAIATWRNCIIRRSHQRTISQRGEQFKTELNFHHLRTIFHYWSGHRLETARIRTIEARHARLVLHDFYIGWYECMQLQRNLRQRDSDFERILRLRATQRVWIHWCSMCRLRVLERHVMEREAREHLSVWLELIDMNKIYQIKMEKLIWKGWMEYVASRRVLSLRAHRFRSLVLSRSVLRHWRFTLLTPLQKEWMAQVAVKLWKSMKRRQASMMLGHWRALARAKRKPNEIQQTIKSRLSSMREINHLVSSSTIGRAHLHQDRSTSPSPQLSPRSILSTHPSGPTTPHQPRRNFHLTLDSTKPIDQDEQKTFQPTKTIQFEGASSSHSHSPLPIRALELPTASRATLASLKTFLVSPPKIGLRVKNEEDMNDQRPTRSLRTRYPPHPIITHQPFESSSSGAYMTPGDLDDTDSSNDEATASELLQTPRGDHQLFMNIPAIVVKTSTPNKSPTTRMT